MLNNNSIPDIVNKIHLIAICGTGMGALAGMLKDKGFTITGSDKNIYPPMSTFLQEKGINIFNGFSSSNLDHNPDLIIVGNAVSKDNPEVKTFLEKKIPFCSMPQAIQHFFGKTQNLVLITGTHGKTTTSSLISWILYNSKLEPGFFIGGILKNFSRNYNIGSGNFFVVEGDEYDTAFFDKNPKFLHYLPDQTVITSIEFDHADIYKDISQIINSFERLLNNLKQDSFLIANISDPIIKKLINNKKCNIETYGTDDSIWKITKKIIEPPWTKFELYYKNELFDTYKTPLMGNHNLLNTVSAIAVLNNLKIDKKNINEGLKNFKGVKRRQEVYGVVNGITVMDDFAHHPTAVRETIKAIRPFYNGKIFAVFEPRTNSSRRNVFQNIYPDSFNDADIICTIKPPLLEKIPENERFSSQQLTIDLKKKNKDAYYFETSQEIINFVKKNASKEDIILVMSNGGFDNICQRLIDDLK